LLCLALLAAMLSIKSDPGQLTGLRRGFLSFYPRLGSGIRAAILLAFPWSEKGRKKVDALRFGAQWCKAWQDPEFQEAVEKNSLIPVYREGEEWVQYVKDWDKEAVRVMKQIGMKVIKE
jgi:hypothetical protein